MAPYSLDLRQKIVATYEAENTSIREVAKQFQVATKTVQTLLNQYRETGDLNHKPLESPIKSPLEAHREKILFVLMKREYGRGWNALWQEVNVAKEYSVIVPFTKVRNTQSLGLYFNRE